MRAERASVQAARVIEKQKREARIKQQMDSFNHLQEAVNQRIDSLVTSLGQLSKVQVEIGGRKLGKWNQNVIIVVVIDIVVVVIVNCTILFRVLVK